MTNCDYQGFARSATFRGSCGPCWRDFLGILALRQPTPTTSFVKQNSPPLCPACWTPIASTALGCEACGHRWSVARRAWPLWVALLLGVAAGVGITVWLMRPRSNASTEPVTIGPAAMAATDARPPEPEARANHNTVVHDAQGGVLGFVLLLQEGPAAPIVGFLPLARLPMRSAMYDRVGQRLDLGVVAVAEAYGFVLLSAVDADGTTALRPRREPILQGEALRVVRNRNGDDRQTHVVGRSPTNPNELLLDSEVPDGATLLDSDGHAAALGLGSRTALAVTPVWSWLDARSSPIPLERAQAQQRARDPAALLEDASAEVNAAATPDATRVALDRLELGIALARGPELVAAYDRALRAGHRLLAQRLMGAGQAREGFAHARLCIQRFAGDIDWLADATVLATSAGEFLAASEFWLELRSRDAARAQEQAAGLIDAFMQAASDRVANSPRDAADLLARGVELFADDAAMRMSYAGALLSSGEGDAALWQARIAASRDPSLSGRLQAIEARTSTSGSVVEVPIDTNTHVLRTACSVGGRHLELVVDTGASITVLPLSLASAGTPTGRRVRIQTASGEIEADLVRFPELKIGTITVRHILAASLDLPGALAGKGLLGMNVLRRLNLELDAARGVLVLRK